MDNRFQILSLDGGGIKGIFSAAVLNAIEDDIGTSITNHFDLIVGTSTGGIIALALGLGLSPQEIVEFYYGTGDSIFQNRLGLRSIIHWFSHKYPSKSLFEGVQVPPVFRDKKLGDSKIRLVIPSYNLGEDDVYMLKTPHHKRLKRDWKLPAWKVALATSSAPTYFPACRSIDGLRLVDGGIWANNPSMVGLVEAVSLLNVDLRAIHIFNIGTSNPIVSRPNFLNWGGKIVWANQAVDVIMRAQSLGIHKQVLHLLGEEKVLRIDPAVPSGLFDLDKVKMKDQLLAKAAHESRIHMPSIEANFLSHTAAPYSPIYK
jgi:patatin-like phospholipase/acyl hydrolase